MNVARRLGVEERQAAFNAALLGQDALGVVLRAHIYIEHELLAFIQARLSSPEAFDAIELDYAGRVKLAVALGLPSDFKSSLSFIGTLRNRFAHKLDAIVTKQDADNFEKALSPTAKEIAQNSYLGSHAKARPGEKAMPLKQQEPMDRIALYFVTLWGGMAVVASQARDAK